MRKPVIDNRCKSAYETIGNNVARLRGKMNIGNLAKKAGVSRQTIAAAEASKAISLESLVKIADALSVHPADLFLSNEDRNDVTYKSKLLLDRINKLFDGIDKK